MAVGWIFKLSGDAYQLLAVPLVLLFQHFVSRRPIQQIWVREAETFRLDRAGIALAALLMALAAYALSQVATAGHSWVFPLLIPSCAGAIFAAFAIRLQSAAQFWRALPSFGAAQGIGFVVVLFHARHAGYSPQLNLDKIPLLAEQFVIMFTGMFIVEEVVFRGMLDSHIYQCGSSWQAQWKSAIFVSALWGLWHLPFSRYSNLSELSPDLIQNLIVEISVGVPLSFCWRRSGTLLLPAAAHALIDAYRNAIFM